jgi:hypothetical protein
MNRRTKITFPVFGYTMIVILANNLVKTGKHLKVDLSDARAAFVTDPTQPEKGWLVFGADPDENTVAHEASHAIRTMLRTAGAKCDDEIFAYHLDHLVWRIHKFLKRGKK